MDFFPFGYLFQAFNDILFAIVDDLPGAGLLCPLRFLRAADGTDQLSAQRLRPLAGNQPDATGRRMKQERFTGLDLVSFSQQVIDRQPFQERCGSLFKGDSVRQKSGLIGNHVMD